MNLVLFTHPASLGSQSQMRLVRALAEAYTARGHRAEIRQPQARVRRLLPQGRLSKWAGYVDQYLIFPQEIKRLLARDPADTLYVFCDQALGPWMPAVIHRPHVVHCLDLMALRSALGLIPENPTSATGRIYQRYIRAGFRRAKHFVSISEKTRADLHEFGNFEPVSSDVVYLGLNHPYGPLAADEAAGKLRSAGIAPPEHGLLLHVGGGQWYKNTAGVLNLYAAYVTQRRASGRPVLPLWMVSPAPTDTLQRLIDSLPPEAQVRFLQGVGNDTLQALYSLAGALIFPSLSEGFGWPIAEALACGCPVLTTGEAPMNEVGGPVANYLPRLNHADSMPSWAASGAQKLIAMLDRPEAERAAAARAGIEFARRYDADFAIDSYLKIYERVTKGWQSPQTV